MADTEAQSQELGRSMSDIGAMILAQEEKTSELAPGDRDTIERVGDQEPPLNAEEAREDDAEALAETENDKKVAKDADESADDVGDDDEYFEIPGEDGAEPTRVAASEVWDGYQRAKALETEVAQLQQAQRTLPQSFEKELVATIEERGKYMDTVQNWLEGQEVIQPDIRLLDENNPHYDPQLYHQQVLTAEHQAHQIAAAKQEQAAMLEKQRDEMARVHTARVYRLAEHLQTAWPELMESQENAQRLFGELGQHYGIDKELIDSVVDPRFYALAKDALAYQRSQAETQKAVKTVRAKPKLVRSATRQQARDSKGRYLADARSRLAANPNDEDAAATALQALIMK